MTTHRDVQGARSRAGRPARGRASGSWVSRTGLGVALSGAFIGGCGPERPLTTGTSPTDTSAQPVRGPTEPVDGGCPWVYERRETVCSRPPGTGVVPMAPPGSVSCSAHDECEDGSFCGGGRCRPKEGAIGTVCIHEALFEGAVEGDVVPPSLGVLLMLSNDSIGEGVYYGFRENLFSGLADSCAPVFEKCFPVNLSDSALVGFVSIEPRDSFFVFDNGYYEDLGRFVNGGCFEILTPDIVYYDTSEEDRPWARQLQRAWISVWYP